MQQINNYPPFYARLTYILLSLICLAYIAVIGKQILSPLIFSFLFAILLLPLSNFLEQKLRFPRVMAAILCVVFFIAAMLGIIYLLGSQLSALGSDWPKLKFQILITIDNLQDWIEQTFKINAAKQTKYVNQQTGKLLTTNTAALGETVLSISSVLLFLIFTFLYTFFILLKRTLLINFLVALFDKAHSHIVYNIIEQVKFIIKKYIVGLVLQMLIVSLLTFMVLSILDVPYALLLGLLTGILNVIPYVGVLSALILSMVITLASASGMQALWVGAALLGIHVIDGNIIMPIIVGSKVKINALIVIVAVVIGEMLWGISGMFLAIPIIAIAKIIFEKVDGLKPWGLLLGDEENLADKVD
ncbi:MAG: AI-2E family transporter [Sphingobacteriales bacterium]|nr:MAG: AI-2E family transporter [Sphingobacteriales bacterium]TAF79166.1 MAG: AI-2E family transporter [Sphingobacteriales bacterium]